MTFQLAIGISARVRRGRRARGVGVHHGLLVVWTNVKIMSGSGRPRHPAPISTVVP